MLSPKQSGVLECHLSHYFKNENYELCISAGFFVTRKKRYSRLSVGCAVLGITTGKKRYSRLSVGCAVLAITTGKKQTTVVSGNFHYDRNKKRYITTGKKRYSRLWREISIFFVVAGNFDYDRKKKDTVVCWREIGSFFVVAGNFDYDREKKKIHYDRKKKDTVVCLMGAWF